MRSKIIFYAFSCLIFVSCASVRQYENPDLSFLTNLSAIEGEYSNSAGNSDKEYATFENVINWLEKDSDSAKFSSVKIELIKDRQIQFSFINESGENRIVKARYKVEKNGFLSLKNKNFRLTGLPYIFGGYKVNKVELGMTTNNEIILNGVNINEGAFLLIFPMSIPKTNFTYTYKKQ